MLIALKSLRLYSHCFCASHPVQGALFAKHRALHPIHLHTVFTVWIDFCLACLTADTINMHETVTFQRIYFRVDFEVLVADLALETLVNKVLDAVQLVFGTSAWSRAQSQQTGRFRRTARHLSVAVKRAGTKVALEAVGVVKEAIILNVNLIVEYIFVALATAFDIRLCICGSI